MATTYSVVTLPPPNIKLSFATPKIKWSKMLAICSIKQSTLEILYLLIQVIQVIHLQQVQQVQQTFCILAECIAPLQITRKHGDSACSNC